MSSAPASLRKLKRLKKANFSIAEEDSLQQEVEQNWKVLTGKLNNQTTNKQKNQIWDSITKKINALDVANRTNVEVRNKWRNTTREAKSVFSKHRAEVNKTGGGPNPKQPSTAVGKVISLLQDTHSFKGIPGGLEETDDFDSEIIQKHQKKHQAEQRKVVGRKQLCRTFMTCKNLLELEKEKQQKEIRKIELQTQLLERLLE